MSRTTIIVSSLFAFTLGCADVAERDDHTSSVSGALNSDPGETTLSFHSPSGIDFEIRSVTPAGQADPIYLKFGGINGETKSDSNVILFRGDIVGATDSLHYAAAIAPLTAVLFGLASTDQVTESTGLTYGIQEIHYASKSPRMTSVALVQQAAAYAFLKEGPAAGALANSYLVSLGIDPCPTAGIVTGQ
jgi:hypothetical protein